MLRALGAVNYRDEVHRCILTNARIENEGGGFFGDEFYDEPIPACKLSFYARQGNTKKNP